MERNVEDDPGGVTTNRDREKEVIGSPTRDASEMDELETNNHDKAHMEEAQQQAQYFQS